MADMGNIKTKHRSGCAEAKPSVGKGGHPMQKPGDASKNPTSAMKWSRGAASDMKK